MTKSEKPRLGCATLVLDGKGRLLLGQRAKAPMFGKWIIPGGGVEFLEPIAAAARREIKEELGVELGELHLFDVAEIVNPPEEHRVVIYFYANLVDGTIKASSDLSDARFFDEQEVRAGIADGIFTPTVALTLGKWLER